MGFPGGPVIKNSPANAGDERCGFDTWVKKTPWRRKWQSTPVLSVESQRVGLDSVLMETYFLSNTYNNTRVMIKKHKYSL